MHSVRVSRFAEALSHQVTACVLALDMVSLDQPRWILLNTATMGQKGKDFLCQSVKRN
jgi:hypothetical protein